MQTMKEIKEAIKEELKFHEYRLEKHLNAYGETWETKFFIQRVDQCKAALKAKSKTEALQLLKSVH